MFIILSTNFILNFVNKNLDDTFFNFELVALVPGESGTSWEGVHYTV